MVLCSLRDALARSLQAKERAAGVQHRPARHADGAGRARWDVGVGERRPLSDQAIKVGRVNRLVPQGADRVEALIVSEEKQDVRPCRHGRTSWIRSDYNAGGNAPGFGHRASLTRSNTSGPPSWPPLNTISIPSRLLWGARALQIGAPGESGTIISSATMPIA